MMGFTSFRNYTMLEPYLDNIDISKIQVYSSELVDDIILSKRFVISSRYLFNVGLKDGTFFRLPALAVILAVTSKPKLLAILIRHFFKYCYPTTKCLGNLSQGYYYM